MDLREVVIETERLVLRSFRSADDDEIFAATTPTLTRYLVWEPPATLDEQRATTSRWVAMMAEGRDLTVVSRRAADGAFIGLVALHRPDTQEPAIGVWVKEAAHGSGFGREGVTGLVSWARETLKPRSFSYPVSRANHPSRAIAEALGGTLVGTNRFVKASGVVLDQVLYRIPG